MYKPKIWLSLSLFLILALLVAACQPVQVQVQEAPGAGAEVSGPKEEKIQLLYLTHSFDPAIEINERVIEEFEEMHPEVEIVYDHAPHSQYEQKILTAYAGGEGPDVFWAGDWMVPQFIEQGIIAPVAYDKFGVNSAREFLELFEPGSLDPYVHEGEVYTGGLSEFNTFSVFINVDHFEEAGLPLPPEDEPITWAEFLDLAEQLAQHDENGNVTRNGFAWPITTPIWNVLILEPLVYQQGGSIVDEETGLPDLTSPEVVKTFEFVHELRFERNAFDPALYTGLTSGFGNGEHSMIIAGPWAIAPIAQSFPDLNFKIVPLPKWEGGERVTTLYSWAWFVNPNIEPEKQALAWEFVNLLSSKGQTWWDGPRYLQARKGQADTGEDLNEYRISTEPMLPVFLEDFKYGQYEFRSTHYFELSDIWTRAVTRVLEGEDVQAVLQEAQIAAEFAVE